MGTSEAAFPQKSALRAVIFLGNPGEEYAQTRHNAGRLLAQTFNISPIPKFKGLFSQYPVDGRAVFFLQPETYMNLSGEAAAALCTFYRIAPEECLVVHDEIELPLGTLALKWSGGLGGHNGLRSIKTHFGTVDFWRLRIGVDRPPHNDIAGWVLSPFSTTERPLLDTSLAAARALLLQALLEFPVEQKIRADGEN